MVRRSEVRDLIGRLGREAAALREREILAPLLPNARIRARVEGLLHEYRVRDAFVGWGVFRPTSEREARLVAPALPWQREAYLDLLPALRVILLWPDPEQGHVGRWWAIAYNAGDARARFGLDDSRPLPIYLCDPEDGANRFERVLARVDGRTLWYGGPDVRADPAHAEWLREAATAEELPERLRVGLADTEKLALVYDRLRSLDEADRTARLRAFRAEARTERERVVWLRRMAERRELEDRLRHALAKADATLRGYTVIPSADGSPGHVLVEWSYRGEARRYRSTLADDTAVIASGICLRGRDRDFDLTSLVGVMAEAP